MARNQKGKKVGNQEKKEGIKKKKDKESKRKSYCINAENCQKSIR